MTKVTYVGLDVHLKSIAVVWGKAKETPEHLEVPNTREGLANLARRVGSQDVWGVYEASSCGFGVYERMSRWGWKMSIVAPTHVAKSAHGRKRKTDVRDAELLRDLLMSHGELGTKLPAVWIPDRVIREHREIVRRRLKLGETLSAVKAGIGSVLRMHGIERPEDLKTLWTQKHVRWLWSLTGQDGTPTAVRTVLASQLREYEFVEKEGAEMQRQLEELSETEPYRAPALKMKEIRGVGTVTAMTFLLELGDVKRFRNRRQVASYLGLAPSCYESGEATDRKGRITRMGPSRVRKVLNQAAWAFLRENVQWRAWYTAVARRRGPKKAIVGLMRRLGIELWQRARCA